MSALSTTSFHLRCTFGGRAVAIKADVANESEIVSMFAAAERELGPIAGLVNSAGIGFQNRVEALDATQLARMFSVNVVGLMLCCREAAKRLRDEFLRDHARSPMAPRVRGACDRD